jgi:hypothetical protein
MGRYAPTFLETLEFRIIPVTKPLLDALKTVKQSAARRLPNDVPTDFIRRRWEPHVRPDGEIDRKYYELCAMSEVKNVLRSAAVWAAGSR